MYGYEKGWRRRAIESEEQEVQREKEKEQRLKKRREMELVFIRALSMDRPVSVVIPIRSSLRT